MRTKINKILPTLAGPYKYTVLPQSESSKCTIVTTQGFQNQPLITLECYGCIGLVHENVNVKYHEDLLNLLEDLFGPIVVFIDE